MNMKTIRKFWKDKSKTVTNVAKEFSTAREKLKKNPIVQNLQGGSSDYQWETKLG